MATEIRELSPCKKVLLRDYGELFIQQGEKESLTVEADASLLNRISTQVQDEQLIISITGGLWDHFERFFRYGWQYTRVKLTLTVKDLNSLDVIGGGRVHVSRLNTEQLDIRLGGAGEINFEDLHAQKLTARLPGAGKIGISGEVDEQNISMSGAGAYIAHRLKSVHANVNLMGIGSVSIWAVESLAASLDGIGSISYYGHPTVQEDLRGFGKLIAMDTPQMSDVFPSSSPPSSQASSNYFRENDEEECSPFFHKRHQTDSLHDIVWALIFIWSGVLLLANNLGWLQTWLEYFPALQNFSLSQFSFGVWSLVLLGVGGIQLIEVGFRWIFPAMRKPLLGKLIFALILIGIGLDGLISWMVLLPIILIILGIFVMFRGCIALRG